MITFLPTRPGRLADVPSFARTVGGAESNVACMLAAAGHTARWVSRVGTDGFGDHLLEHIASHGVDVSAVHRDPARPTGVYFRTAGDRGTGDHEVAYYRAGSAASAMSPADVDPAALRSARVLHLSGITAALSAGCRDLLYDLMSPYPGRPLISFDVNHRPSLWDDRGSAVLLELARRADVVFVGEDEAEAAWGVRGGAAAVREVLPEPGVLVVKRGAAGAVAFTSAPTAEPAPAPTPGAGTAPPHPAAVRLASDAVRLAPHAVRLAPAAEARALRVDVVAATGAGDAFAAGFLAATLRGLPLRDRLRHGHLFAAAALTVPGDLAAPPARDHADRLAALDDAEWEKLRLGPGWTQAGQAAAKETNAP
ncbi:sugar kinase [Streptomyces sp. J2-1]|uniref:sugar kinase n=1 Tax=Streptomyces corallincola TaxID=2851888 RepID=UPI001C38FEC3|nr:sugar kinase [Streptomyces corallincola]MBV2356494.1 sugar kinase [Streptomyces corallincola]